VIRLPRRPSQGATERRPRFTEGLIAGALIGAAIAGSTLWSRLRRGREIEPPEPGEPPEAPSPDGDPAPA
jgi:hypothetical protein